MRHETQQIIECCEQVELAETKIGKGVFKVVEKNKTLSEEVII